MIWGRCHEPTTIEQQFILQKWKNEKYFQAEWFAFSLTVFKKRILLHFNTKQKKTLINVSWKLFVWKI